MKIEQCEVCGHLKRHCKCGKYKKQEDPDSPKKPLISDETIEEIKEISKDKMLEWAHDSLDAVFGKGKPRPKPKPRSNADGTAKILEQCPMCGDWVEDMKTHSCTPDHGEEEEYDDPEDDELDDLEADAEGEDD